MPDALTSINLRQTPQRQQARADQVANNAGGFVFAVDPLTQLRRFLVLGTEGGTYYSSSAELTKDNAAVVLAFARERTVELVDIVLDLSTHGRAPKQQPLIFALAAAASLGDAEGRRYALARLKHVCRTGTQLFYFARYVEQFRGWGRGLRTAVADWYLSQTPDNAAYQAVKYRQREGWSHRDLLRLAHPQAESAAQRALFEWICRGTDSDDLPKIVLAFQAAQASTNTSQWVSLIESDAPLTWEMLPDAALNEPKVWAALLDKGMPTGALIRQLPRLTRLDVLKPMDARTAKVVAQLTDPAQLQRARIHPVNLLVAGATYGSGRSERGSSAWTPLREIVDAFDAAFYASYGAVESTNLRTLLALDVSGSMGSPAAGTPLSCREVSAALALVTANVEPRHHIVGFTSANRNAWRSGTVLTPLDISPRQRLQDAVNKASRLDFGATDCALPMIYAQQRSLEVDTFVIYTDNETWYGGIHPFQALRDYRAASGIDAKLVVVALTPTRFSIADPTDPGMLDVAGFDSAVPQLISDFGAGRV